VGRGVVSFLRSGGRMAACGRQGPGGDGCRSPASTRAGSRAGDESGGGKRFGPGLQDAMGGMEGGCLQVDGRTGEDPFAPSRAGSPFGLLPTPGGWEDKTEGVQNPPGMSGEGEVQKVAEVFYSQGKKEMGEEQMGEGGVRVPAAAPGSLKVFKG